MAADHQWVFDWPWHMGRLRDWFYMVNTGSIPPLFFLHVRILGVRSVWTIKDTAWYEQQKERFTSGAFEALVAGEWSPELPPVDDRNT